MIAGLILAGGDGRRLGGNKPFHPYAGRPLISHVVERLSPQVEVLWVNAGSADHPLASRFSGLNQTMIYDDATWAGMGPLSGVLSGLTVLAARAKTSDEQTVLITTPCDMPELPDTLVEGLLSVYDPMSAEVVYYKGVRDYPLCALWSLSVLAPLKEALNTARDAGGLSVLAFLRSLSVHTVAVTDEAAFVNINR